MIFFNKGDQEAATALDYIRRLRKVGISCELYPQAAKLKKQFDYALKRGSNHVVIIGDKEMEEGQVTTKNMMNCEQKTMDGK